MPLLCRLGFGLAIKGSGFLKHNPEPSYRAQAGHGWGMATLWAMWHAKAIEVSWNCSLILQTSIITCAEVLKNLYVYV
jgi:hypothetical protein